MFVNIKLKWFLFIVDVVSFFLIICIDLILYVMLWIEIFFWKIIFWILMILLFMWNEFVEEYFIIIDK